MRALKMVHALPCLKGETNLLWASDQLPNPMIITKLAGGNASPSAPSRGNYGAMNKLLKVLRLLMA